MKRVLTIGCLAVVAMGFISCSEGSDEVNYYTTESSGPTPVLEGFNQLTITVPAATTLSSGDEFVITWEAGDKLSVYESGGDWVADLLIDDATAATSTFTVEGDVRLDDDAIYTIVYPSRANDQIVSYDDYLASIEDISADQTQTGDTFDHLKEESCLEMEFKGGDDPIALENTKVITSLKFEVASDPSTLIYDDGVASSYALNFADGTKAESTSKTSYTAYMMTDPVEMEADQTRVLAFSVSASDGTLLVNKSIKTSIGVSSGDSCNIDIDKGSIDVVENNNGGDGDGSTGGDGDGSTGGDGDGSTDDDDTAQGGSSTEDLTTDDGVWN